MPVTQSRGRQIRDDDVGREDINITTTGRALITKLIAGTNIGLSYTGADVGTGDVTVNLTGTVAVANGGTGATSLTGLLVGNGTSAFTAVAGTANQLLRRNAGNTAYEFFTHDFVSITAATANTIPKWTSGTALGLSNISDNGSLVTIASNSYITGTLGIGGLPTATVLRVGGQITGATTSYGVLNNAVIQSGVTAAAYYYLTNSSTQATTFTLGSLVHYYAIQGTFGAGSTVSNQFGFIVDSGLIGATNNYGFYGNLASGTGRWNLYMAGTADNYIAGKLGLGSITLTSSTLRVSSQITGATTFNAINSDGQIQSDVTATVNYFRSSLGTQAASFNLSSLSHYTANQGTIGAGSSITTQTGFNAEAGLIGATNNYGFRGLIPSGTGRWNLYMDGTANNYLAGNLRIGAPTEPSGVGTLGVTYSSQSNFGIVLNNTYTAASNNSYFLRKYTNGTEVANFWINNQAGALLNINGFNGINFNTGGSTAGTTRVTIDSVGVGVGTTNPLALIHIRNNTAPSIYLEDGDATNTFNITDLTNTGGNFSINTISSTGVFVSSDYQIVKTSTTDQYHRWFTGGTERLRLINNGNFGIGTTNPLSKIHARATAGPNTQTTVLQLTDTGTGTSNGAAINFSYTSTNILNARIGASSVSGGGAALAFATAPSDGAAAVTVMTLTKTANVLVGTGTDNGARLRTVGGVVDFQGTAATDGGQLGTELLTSANWTSTGWTGDFATGFTHTTGNTTALSNTLAAVVGTYYQITWTVTGRTAGSFTVSFGGYLSGSGTASSAVGPRATTTAGLVITPTSDFDGTIVISIRVVTPGSASVVLRNSVGGANGEIRVFTSGSNTSFGLSALRNVTTGVINAAFANQALANLTSGTSNVAVGPNSQEFLTIGTHNTSVGVGTLRFNISGIFNTAVGESALGTHTSPASTTAIGRGVLAAITSGSFNTAVGANAFLSLTTGNYLVAIGESAGRLINAGTNHLTATNSIFIGADSRPSADGNTNEIVIGTSGRGNGSNTVTIGNSSTTNNYFTGTINVTDSGLFQGRMFAWNTTTPGTALGTIHLGNSSATTNAGAAITFSSRVTNTTAQAGIYVNTDGAYGSRMYIATTNSFATGAQTALAILEQGNIEVTRGTLAVLSTTASTSTTTGALRSAGGLGVAGAAWIGGTVNISGHLTSTSATFTNAISVVAASGAIGVTSRGRATDNFFISEFRDNTGATRYGYVQSHSDFGGTLAVVADGGARIDLDSRGVRVTTGSFGVGVTTINASARLQVDSTTQGVLFPRMTAAQRAAIASPANMLMVTQTDSTAGNPAGLYIYINSAWFAITMVQTPIA